MTLVVLEGALLGTFVLVGGIAGLHRAIGLRSPFHLNEAHHAYVGAVLVLVGLVGGWGGFSMQATGFVLTADDLGQHIVQTFRDEDYQSPLHRLYGKYLWPMRWVQRLTRWLDELFR